jgi:hypothetical protein
VNRYRVRLPLLVHTEDGSYKQGEEFEKDFSAEDETTNLDSGLLEVVPRKYKVTGTSRVHDTAPGEEFEVALRIGEEAHLVQAGHIKRVNEQKSKTGKKKEG